MQVALPRDRLWLAALVLVVAASLTYNFDGYPLLDPDEGVEVRHHPDAILAGAIGAALLGAFRYRQLERRGKTRTRAVIPS